MKSMKIAIGCDPNAEIAKQKLIEYLRKMNCGKITDFGSTDPIYCHVAIKVAEEVAKGNFDCGILLCGTGIGMSIAANKVKGAYAAVLSDIYSAKRARLSNDVNIACFGAFTTGEKVREELLSIFLTNKFVSGSPSQPKIDAIKKYEQERR